MQSVGDFLTANRRFDEVKSHKRIDHVLSLKDCVLKVQKRFENILYLQKLWEIKKHPKK